MLVMQRWGWVLSCAIALGACSDDEGEAETAQSAAGEHAGAAGQGGEAGKSAAGSTSGDKPKADLAAFEATGLTKYLGKARPADTETSGSHACSTATGRGTTCCSSHCVHALAWGRLT